MSARPRILFIDAYDSFSNNIVSLLTDLLHVDVSVVPIDSPLLADPSAARDLLRRKLPAYAAVVCGPGPGSPDSDADVGLMRFVWDLPLDESVPVLGICLGFQSLVSRYGGRIRRLRGGLHGMVREIVHRGSHPAADSPGDVFSGVGPFRATLYHSLCADVGQDGIAPTEWEEARWRPGSRCPDLEPLAWAEEVRENGVERILMAVRHRDRPLWGLQYHPESVCTEAEGNRVVLNWFSEALKWNAMRRGPPTPLPRAEEGILGRRATRPSLLSRPSATERDQSQTRSTLEEARWRTASLGCQLRHKTLALSGPICAPDIVEILACKESEQIVLDSSNSHLPAPADAISDVRGRYSIVGLDVAGSLRLEYHAGDDHAVATLRPDTATWVSARETIALEPYGGIWNLLADFQDKRRTEAPASFDTPFVGGFMGYVTYEQGLSDIGVSPASERAHRRPDICLLWITKSVVIDHRRGLLHVQELRPGGPPHDRCCWLEDTVSRLRESLLRKDRHTGERNGAAEVANAPPVRLGKENKRPPSTASAGPSIISAPAVADYEDKVRACQEHIAAGDSYELCLTAQTTIVRPRKDTVAAATSTSDSWRLFKTLRTLQPAPFASYLRLGGATLVSSSPERFLRYDGDGLCSMRPMKGTVRKSPAVPTLARAEEILHVPKEEAENLMIVDLVRHDLHGVCGPGNVSVPQLMQVEEYESVFQMVTVVEGRLPPPEEGTGYTGLDVLAASLPPGSMTGAPKKRSCEILQQIEDRRERCLYSGVVGYMCASGRGDWSVTIRSMFRWDDELPSEAPGCEGDESLEVWRVGAGGAVTILSTPEGEREEMFVKLAGTLSGFAE